MISIDDCNLRSNSISITWVLIPNEDSEVHLRLSVSYAVFFLNVPHWFVSYYIFDILVVSFSL